MEFAVTLVKDVWENFGNGRTTKGVLTLVARCKAEKISEVCDSAIGKGYRLGDIRQWDYRMDGE